MKAKALIIDDNVSNILVLQQLLMMEDVASLNLSSTKDLVFQLDSITGIDIVFLDLEMPVLNGYDALDVIRAHPNFELAKVVAYSVHVSEVNVIAEQGFDGFLGKPINADVFPQQLWRILDGERIFYVP